MKTGTSRLEIEYVDVDKLIPYENNAKEHPDEQVQTIVNSIDEFDMCDPIAVWTNDNGQLEIVEGHGRLMALKRIGADTVPIIKLDHLTDEQRRAYALVHNKLTMNSDFDMDRLQAELDAIDSIDMSELGFDELDMEFMEFDGEGDGGGSRMGNGGFVRIVIGPFICDFKDEEQKYYPLASQLDDEEKVVAAIKGLFDDGILP